MCIRDRISLASESASPSIASHGRRVFDNGERKEPTAAEVAEAMAQVAQAQVADETVDPHRPAPTTPGTKRMLTSEWLEAMPATFSPAVSDGGGSYAASPAGGGSYAASPAVGGSYAASPAVGVPESVPEEPEVEAAAEEEAAAFNLGVADEDAATVEVALSLIHISEPTRPY